MPEPTSEPSSTSAAPSVGPPAAGTEPMGRPRTAVLSATVAVVALVGGWTWAAAVQPGGFDARAESISALAAAGTPHRWIMTTALLLTGAAHLVTAWALVPARRNGRILLAAAGVATLAVAVLPLPSRTGSSAAHTTVATLSFVLLAVWPWFAARPDGPRALDQRVARPAAGVLSVAVASLAIGLGGNEFGLHERVVALLTVAWPLVTAVSTWWWAGHRVGSRRVRHVLAVVGLVIACGAAGTSATAIAPATAQTRHYQASVVLDPDPPTSARSPSRRRRSVTSSWGSPGAAPGIRTVPQVNASIADVLSRPQCQPGHPAPGAGGAERGDPRRRRRRAHPVRRRWAVAFVVVGARRVCRAPSPTRATGHPRRRLHRRVGARDHGEGRRCRCMRPTSRSGRRRSPRRAFSEPCSATRGSSVTSSARATQVAPYLRNVIALSTALQQKYEAAPLESDTSLRVLLVSDIHAGNQYDLMRTIIEEEGHRRRRRRRRPGQLRHGRGGRGDRPVRRHPVGRRALPLRAGQPRREQRDRHRDARPPRHPSQRDPARGRRG